MEYEQKQAFRLEVKSFNDKGDFEGIANVMGVKDLDDDIIDEGAFSRTLSHKKGRVRLLADHDPRLASRIGIGELAEQGKNLQLNGRLNLEKQSGRDTLSDIRFSKEHKVPLGLSVGFNIVKQKVIDGIRHIKEVALWEVSVVTFPANTGSLIKSAKAVVPFQDLAMGDREKAWNASAADKRVRAWADAEEEPNAKYRQAFVWYDRADADSFGAYKLQIADIVDGELVALPRGVFAAAGAAQGARTPLDVPDADMPKIRSHLAKYYAKMDLTPPWDKGASIAPALELACNIPSDYPLDEAEQELAAKTVSHLTALLEASSLPGNAHKHLFGDDDADGLSPEVQEAVALMTETREALTK